MTSLKKPPSPAKIVLFSSIVVFVILGTVELSLRAWANFFRLPYLTYSVKYGRPALVPNAKVHTPLENVEVNSLGFVGPEFKKEKSSGLRRIISLGDSCTFDGGWYPKTYPGQLDAALKRQHPTQHIEAINAGISGYNSEFALARLRGELLEYDPDLVIIYIGWNDLMKINPANPAATGRHSALANILNQSYLVKAYSKFIFFYLRPLVMKPKLTSDPVEASAFDNFVPSAYESNLDAMLDLLKARHIVPVLVTLPTVVRSKMTQEEIDKDHVFFPYYAGSFSLGKFLSLLRAYNAVIHRVAEKHEVLLVDLYSIIEQYPKDDLFEDTMHPNTKGNAIIAGAMAEALKEWASTSHAMQASSH
jgi:lysophospholipase L1-like esterase